MSASSGRILLYNLNRDCFKEICRYLDSQSLHALWCSNHSPTQALLNHSSAFSMLHIANENLKYHPSLIQWSKTITEPRLGGFSAGPALYSSWRSSTKLPSYQWLHDTLLSRFVIERVEIMVSDSNMLETLYHQWKAATSLPKRQQSVFQGTTQLKLTVIDSFPPPLRKWTHNAFLELMPDSLTDLELSSTFLAGVPFSQLSPSSLRNIQTLKLLYNASTILEPTEDLVLLPGLMALPLLQTLSLRIIDLRESRLPRLLEVPSSVSALNFDFQYALLIMWPSSLTSLNYCFDVSSSHNLRGSLLEKFARHLTWHYLGVNCPHLSHLDYSRYSSLDSLHHIGPTLESCRRSFEEAFGEQFQNTFASCIADLLGYIDAPPTNETLLQRLPRHLQSLRMSTEKECRESSSVNSRFFTSLCSFVHLLKLHLIVDVVSQELLIPPSVTDLTLWSEEVLDSASFAHIRFPPRLKRFSTQLLEFIDLCSLRDKLGPQTDIVIVSTSVSSNQLCVAFPDHSGSSRDCAILLDDDPSDNALPTLPIPHSRVPCAPSSLHAEGIELTFQGFLDGITAAVGHRTTTLLSFQQDAIWPSSITSIRSFADDNKLRGFIGHGLRILLPDLQTFFNSPSLKSISLYSDFYSPPDIPSSCSLTSIEMGSQLPYPQRCFTGWPSTLTALRHLSFEAFGWDKVAASLPLLTELWVPYAGCQLLEASLPRKLRALACRISSPRHDTEIYQLLAPFPNLARLELNASGFIFTASAHDLSVITRPMIFPALKSLFARKRGLQLDLRGSPNEVFMNPSKFPPWINSANLLGHQVWHPDDLVWPPDLTALTHAIHRVTNRALPPHLRKLHLHLTFSFSDCAQSLPCTLESLTLTTNHSRPKHHCAPAPLPCAAVLRSLIVPDSYFNPLTSFEPSLPNYELPNLTRLVAPANGSSDLQVSKVIRSCFPKLERLTFTHAVRLTGVMALDGDSNVSFESVASETRSAILSLLESRYRKRVNLERSSDPSALKPSKSATPLEFALETESPTLEPESPPTTLIPIHPSNRIHFNAEKAEFNAFFTVDLGHKEGFHLPPLATRLSILAHPLHRNPIQPLEEIDYTSIETPAGDTIEEWVRQRSDLNNVHLAANFSLDTIANWNDLDKVSFIEYDSMIPYKPGRFFMQSSLIELIIHSPIALTSSTDPLKWTLPPQLARLICSELAKPVEFVTAGDLPCTNLIELELPKVTWHKPTLLPPNLRKLVIGSILSEATLGLLKASDCEVHQINRNTLPHLYLK